MVSLVVTTLILIIIEWPLFNLIIASTMLTVSVIVPHTTSISSWLLLTVHPVFEEFEVATGYLKLLPGIRTDAAIHISAMVIAARVSSRSKLLLCSTGRLRVLLRWGAEILLVPLKTTTKSRGTLVIVWPRRWSHVFILNWMGSNTWSSLILLIHLWVVVVFLCPSSVSRGHILIHLVMVHLILVLRITPILILIVLIPKAHRLWCRHAIVRVLLLLIARSIWLLHSIILRLGIIAARVVRLLTEPATARGQEHSTWSRSTASLVTTVWRFEDELFSNILEQWGLLPFLSESFSCF